MGGRSSAHSKVDKQDLEKVRGTVSLSFGAARRGMTWSPGRRCCRARAVARSRSRARQAGRRASRDAGAPACAQVEELKLVSNFTDTEVARLIKIFNDLDIDRSGTINKDELFQLKAFNVRAVLVRAAAPSDKPASWRRGCVRGGGGVVGGACDVSNALALACSSHRPTPS